MFAVFIYDEESDYDDEEEEFDDEEEEDRNEHITDVIPTSSKSRTTEYKKRVAPSTISKDTLSPRSSPTNTPVKAWSKHDEYLLNKVGISHEDLKANPVLYSSLYGNKAVPKNKDSPPVISFIDHMAECQPIPVRRTLDYSDHMSPERSTRGSTLTRDKNSLHDKPNLGRPTRTCPMHNDDHSLPYIPRSGTPTMRSQRDTIAQTPPDKQRSGTPTRGNSRGTNAQIPPDKQWSGIRTRGSPRSTDDETHSNKRRSGTPTRRRPTGTDAETRSDKRQSGTPTKGRPRGTGAKTHSDKWRSGIPTRGSSRDTTAQTPPDKHRPGISTRGSPRDATPPDKQRSGTPTRGSPRHTTPPNKQRSGTPTRGSPRDATAPDKHWSGTPSRGSPREINLDKSGPAIRHRQKRRPDDVEPEIVTRKRGRLRKDSGHRSSSDSDIEVVNMTDQQGKEGRLSKISVAQPSSAVIGTITSAPIDIEDESQWFDAEEPLHMENEGRSSSDSRSTPCRSKPSLKNKDKTDSDKESEPLAGGSGLTRREQNKLAKKFPSNRAVASKVTKGTSKPPSHQRRLSSQLLSSNRSVDRPSSPGSRAGTPVGSHVDKPRSPGSRAGTPVGSHVDRPRSPGSRAGTPVGSHVDRPRSPGSRAGPLRGSHRSLTSRAGSPSRSNTSKKNQLDSSTSINMQTATPPPTRKCEYFLRCNKKYTLC